MFQVAVEEENGTRKEVRVLENKTVTFFGWEKLDYVDKIKAEFGL